MVALITHNAILTDSRVNPVHPLEIEHVDEWRLTIFSQQHFFRIEVSFIA